jgi:hypothetical protein
MQSPPAFITDPDGEETPFNETWVQTTQVYTPTSGEGYWVEASFKRKLMAVEQHQRVTFVAQDPQAKDKVWNPTPETLDSRSYT